MEMVQDNSPIKTVRNEKEPKPLCSICIANYNGEELLSDCLDSVFSQQDAISFEVIVHDDASTDGSLDLIRKKYPQVIILQSPTNVGYCTSNNRMVKQAQGEYILLLNNDAALKSDALLVLFENAVTQTPQGILTLPQYDWRTGELIDRGCLLDPFYNPVPNLDHRRNDVAMVIGACLWMPRRLWQELGGFPEWMGSIAEDMYLCCLARLCGYPVQAARTSGYRHWQGKSFSGERTAGKQLVSTYRRRALSERNKTFVMLITCPACFLAVIFPMHLLVLEIEGVVVALLKRNKKLFTDVYLPLPGIIWKHRSMLNRLRKQIKLKKKIGNNAFMARYTWIPWKLRMLFRFGLPEVR